MTAAWMSVEACETNWWLGEPLTGRVAALRSQSSAGVRSGTESQRSLRWREQFPFGDEQFFAQRLTACDISEEEFLRVVGGAGSDPKPPVWARTLVHAYLAPQRPESALTDASSRPTDGLYPFLRCAAPLVDHFAEQLRDNAAGLAGGHPSAPFHAPTVHQLFLGDLLEAFKRMLAPAMLLELNLARITGQLAGAGPAERFYEFIDGLGNSATALLRLSRYPVLARQLVVRGECWAASSLAFLRDLADDRPAIEYWLDGEPQLDRLAGVQTQLADSHCGGRSVVVAAFDSGLRLVYKPRSLAIDRHFQQLLQWTGSRVDGMSFRVTKILDRGTHGWTEYVRPTDCESRQGVRRFYERQGGYLALLYLLNGGDLHCENVIAAGEHPVLVDVEALFHAHVPTRHYGVHGVAARAWETSVLRTGLLPTPMRWSDDHEPLDRSGLGAPEHQLSPFGVLCPDAVGTDEMRLVRQRHPIKPPRHLPTIAGRPAEQIDVSAVVRGFAKVYRTLMAHRGELRTPTGPIARFGGDQIRIVLRHTLVYTRLLSESFHPDVLRDALDRDQLFDLLWADVPDNAQLGRVVADECRDLWNGDVPVFYSRVGSRAIESSSGKTIPRFLPEPTDAPVRRRLLALCDEDLERQSWFIRAAFASLEAGRANISRETEGWTPTGTVTTTRDRLIAHACRIGERLAVLALRSGDEAGWMGLRHEGKDDWSLRPVGPDLYDGTAGIVLFLAHLAAVTGEQRYRRLAAAGARNLQNQVAALTPTFTPIGAFNGAGGLIYLYSHLATLWDQPQWLDDAHTIIDELPQMIESDSSYDVMGGAAGCIAGLLAMHAVAPSNECLAVATACGDHLVRSARATRPGIGWPSALFGVPLAGFSHGASGIAGSLLALHRLTGESRFREAALAALAYERSLYDPNRRHWADLRPREEAAAARTPMVAWCHGAAGIGLSRLGMLSALDSQSGRRDIAIAVDATLAWGFGDNHCLCHGDLGNLDFLLQAGEVLAVPAWNAEVQRLTSKILDEIERSGWRCGISKPVDTPGLMTGLAGIGYGMLRLAHPQSVPLVTTLGPPAFTAVRE